MINGIINLRKEAGMTSHDAVSKLREILREKKIGHGGILGPDVVGVLPTAVGKVTRVTEYMTEAGKIYRGQICLGCSTATEDASGERLETTPVSDVAVEEVDLALRSFIGETTQVPPIYSAAKANGKRLYEYTHAGQTVERPERHVTICDFKRTSPLEFKDDCCYFDFEVVCSKGTYIRTLSVGLGKKLGYASHISYLEREASAGLRPENALTLAEIADKIALEDFSFLLSVEYGIMDLPRADLTEDQKTEISFGRKIALDRQSEQLAGFYEDKLVAILEPRDDLYKPRKVFI